MPSFKSLLNKVKTEGGSASAGLSGASRFGTGIGNQGPTNIALHGDDRAAKINVILRGLQTFFSLIALFIAIYMATFQNKWVGGTSGLTGLILFLVIASLLASCLFLLVPVVYERSNYQKCKGLHRGLQEARVGLVLNGAFTVLLLILSTTQTISAYTSAGCKDPLKDPHAAGKDRGDFIKKIPGWCRTKRAEAAFIWFMWITWLMTLLLFIRQWRMDRKGGPRIPPFVHPVDDSAFEPIHNFEDNDADFDDHHIKSGRYGEGGDGLNTNPPYNFSNANPLSDIESRYGFTSAAATHRPSYDPSPFADQTRQTAEYSRPSYDYNAYSSTTTSDPYSAPSKSNIDPVPQLPGLAFSPPYR